MNSALMIAVADLIEFNDRFDLCSFADGPTDLDITPADVLHNCQTTACIAGWVNALADRAVDDVAAAAIDLGLNIQQAYELFVPTTRSPSVWQMDDPYGATAVEAAKCLREIAAGNRTFECDRPKVIR